MNQNFDIPEFQSASSELKYPFDLDKYIKDFEQDARSKYEKYFGELILSFKKSLEAGDDNCIIIIEKTTFYSSDESIWYNNVDNMKHNAITNFLHLLTHRKYPFQYQLKTKHNGTRDDGYDSDGCNYVVWKEITIKLK